MLTFQNCVQNAFPAILSHTYAILRQYVGNFSKILLKVFSGFKGETYFFAKCLKFGVIWGKRKNI